MDPSHLTSEQSGDPEVSLQFLTPDQDQSKDDWISDQFNKLPYIIYKLCLVLTIILVLGIQPELISYQFSGISESRRILLAILSGSSILGGLSCGEMLYAMMKRKSEFAHKSSVKFQYSLIGIIIGAVFGETLNDDFSKSAFFQLCVVFIMPICMMASFFGGYAVFGVFQSNNSLTRLRNYRSSNQSTKDALLQNALLVDELWKYNEKLNSCSYQFYKIWLKLVAGLMMVVVVQAIWDEIPQDWSSRKIGLVVDLYMLLMYLWTVFCCYEVEVVLGTKMLEKSKRILFYLKIGIVMWIIAPAVDLIFTETKSLTPKYFVTALFCILFLLMTRFSAVKINKILEQRDQFVKASSYSGDHHL